MGVTNQVGKEVMTFTFCFRWDYHVITKDFI